MSAALYDFIVDMNYLSPNDRLVLQKVARYRNTQFSCTLQDQATIAECLGISKRSVIRSVKTLIDAELIDDWSKGRYTKYHIGEWFMMEWDMAVRKAGTNTKDLHEIIESKCQKVTRPVPNCHLSCDTESHIYLKDTSLNTQDKEREENSKDKEEKESFDPFEVFVS
jgi:DNA-binding transcriptional regulator GbsR (MarR family)